eukprot:NODE_1241_length_640_cov_776.379019_g976_i0.p2 GENE.NODE_1241_length_640_cov_776.379019_g976_i0~~NODE_1241_length_640_cov_776.379019_g976_i0.p2  ORF type:complete len:69 (-),score=9.05 NODE_1241_length_640_cov_776.379019_g976_i0:125-331(-)
MLSFAALQCSSRAQRRQNRCSVRHRLHNILFTWVILDHCPARLWRIYPSIVMVGECGHGLPCCARSTT